MISGLLLSLFDSAAYDVLKGITKNAFGKTGDELENRTQNAIESAIEAFFKKYGKKFGKESDSFLAREENWVEVAKKLRHDTPELTIDCINPNGFRNAPTANKEALNYLIKSIKKEFNNDLFLNLLLGVKESIQITKETERNLLKAIEKLSTEIKNLNTKNSSSKLYVDVSGGNLPRQKKLEEGKLYVRNITDSVKITYMRRGNKIYSEAHMSDGAIMYYEIDENAHIKIRQPPYPVEIEIPTEYILKKELISDEKGRQKLIIHGKWGLRVECIKVDENKFTDTSLFNASVSIRAKDKKMVVKPNGLKK